MSSWELNALSDRRLAQAMFDAMFSEVFVWFPSKNMFHYYYYLFSPFGFNGNLSLLDMFCRCFFQGT